MDLRYRLGYSKRIPQIVDLRLFPEIFANVAVGKRLPSANDAGFEAWDGRIAVGNGYSTDVEPRFL